MSLEPDNEDRPLDTGYIVNGNARPMGLMAAELDLQCPTTSPMPSGPRGIQQVLNSPNPSLLPTHAGRRPWCHSVHRPGPENNQISVNKGFFIQ